jgi:hypothetical protein
VAQPILQTNPPLFPSIVAAITIALVRPPTLISSGATQLDFSNLIALVLSGDST